MSQTYMTAKLNLSDGTIVYPQVSLDNVVNSINDPTLATIATGISISVDGGTATLVTNGGSGVAKFVGANGLVVSMNEGNEVVFTAPSVTSVGSAGYADNAGSAVSAGTASVASSLVSGYVATSATNATSAGTAAAIASGAIVGGYKTEIISGNTIGQAKWFNIVNASGATVTVEPGEAYKVNAANSAVTISATLGTTGQWGQEGHAEIFVAGTGNVHTGANVVLANGLEADSVNNCTLRFHDGKCIISVEDHVAGYIVVSDTGTSAGSLYYGLGSASESYIAVDASLNGQVLDLGGVTTSAGEKHLVGNGYQQTIVSGGINCTSKTTFANLGMSGVVVSSGTLTLGDVYVPNGATVSVSGGGLAIEKVTGDGSGVIDLQSSTRRVIVNKTAIASGCSFTGFYTAGTDLDAFFRVDAGGTLKLTNCTGTGNIGTNGSFICLRGYTTVVSASLVNCTVTSNGTHGSVINPIYVYGNAKLDIEDSVINDDIGVRNSGALIPSVTLTGSNVISRNIRNISGASGTVLISSGAIVDLTGNTNTTPISPGGGITFEPGGATVYPSAGSASAYALGGMTVPQLGNTNVVNLNSSHVFVSGGTAIASACTFTGGSSTIGGAFQVTSALLELNNCTVSGNMISVAGGGAFISSNGIVKVYDCTFAPGQSIAFRFGNGQLHVGGNCTLYSVAPAGNEGDSGSVTISSGASINLTSAINPGGGIVVSGGCTVNGVEISGGTYTSIVSSGGSAIVNS